MADQDAAIANHPLRFYKLPDFWSATPAVWFGAVEAQFRLRGTDTQRDKFALVTAVLPEASARRVAHILAAPGDTCYDELKTALLATHQLTSFQKAERLFSAEPLGERRPSELLTEMLELVHPGEGRTRLFAMLFLRRLPPAVRLQLTEDDHEDLSALAEKADHCAASIHHHQQSASQIFSATADNTPETEEQEEFSVAAVGAGCGGRGGQHGCSGQNRPRGGQNRPCPQQQQQFSASQPATDTPAQLARQASGLCRSHFGYGDKAYSCGSNCAWQGN